MTLKGQSIGKQQLASVNTLGLDVEYSMPLEVLPEKEKTQEVLYGASKPCIKEKQGISAILDKLAEFVKPGQVMVSSIKEASDEVWAYLCGMETNSQDLQKLYNDQDDCNSYRLYVALQDANMDDGLVSLLEQVLLQNNTGELIRVKIRAKTTISQCIEYAVCCDMSVKSLEDWVSKIYLEYQSVFEK
jgi:hypothetical protein